jgi:hypothetical protein
LFKQSRSQIAAGGSGGRCSFGVENMEHRSSDELPFKMESVTVQTQANMEEIEFVLAVAAEEPTIDSSMVSASSLQPPVVGWRWGTVVKSTIQRCALGYFNRPFQQRMPKATKEKQNILLCNLSGLLTSSLSNSQGSSVELELRE